MNCLRKNMGRTWSNLWTTMEKLEWDRPNKKIN